MALQLAQELLQVVLVFPTLILQNFLVETHNRAKGITVTAHSVMAQLHVLMLLLAVNASLLRILQDSVAELRSPAN
jgi:hypothetical protein